MNSVVVAFVVFCSFSALVSSVPLDGDKALNNLISEALHNIRIDGQFLANYPFADLSRYPDANTCDRELKLDVTEPSRFRGALKRVYDTGVLRIGVSTLVSLPYFSNATGQPQGFFYNLGLLVANEIGFLLMRPVQAHFVAIPTTNFIANVTQALQTNKVDTVIGVSYLTSRLLLVDYTCWYEAASPVAVFRDESAPLPAGFSSAPTALAGWNNPNVRVATLGGSIFESAVNLYLPQAQKVFFPTMNDAYNAVGSAADIVMAVIGEVSGYNQAHNNRLTQQPNTLVVYGGGNAFATRRN